MELYLYIIEHNSLWQLKLALMKKSGKNQAKKVISDMEYYFQNKFTFEMLNDAIKKTEFEKQILKQALFLEEQKGTQVAYYKMRELVSLNSRITLITEKDLKRWKKEIEKENTDELLSEIEGHLGVYYLINFLEDNMQYLMKNKINIKDRAENLIREKDKRIDELKKEKQRQKLRNIVGLI